MTPVSNQVEPEQAHAKAFDNNEINDEITTTTTTTPFALKLSKGFGLVRQVSSVVVVVWVKMIFVKSIVCAYLPSPLVCTRTYGYCNRCN